MKKRGFGEGKWNGAGGKVEEGETLKQAAQRELEEETTIKLSSDNLEQIAVFNFYFEGKQDWNQQVTLFIGDYDGDFEETEEMKPQWFDIDKIPYDQMWEDDSVWLPEVLKGEKDLKYNFFFDSEGKMLRYEKN